MESMGLITHWHSLGATSAGALPGGGTIRPVRLRSLGSEPANAGKPGAVESCRSCQRLGAALNALRPAKGRA